MTRGLRPAASAMATRSSTFSLRDAAIRTSTSSGLFGAGPSTWKSRLTSSSANGMYWLASASTVSSSSSSFWPAGTMIFLVITMAAGRARATLRLRLPRRFQPRFSASLTWLEVGDVAVGDDVLGQRLDRVALEPEAPLPVSESSTQLERRRRDVDADQRWRLGFEEVQCGRRTFRQAWRRGDRC